MTSPSRQELERSIRRLSGRRRIVARDALLALGLTPGAIEHRVALGALTVLHRGVYGVGPPPFPAASQRHAALMACRPDATLGLLAAAATAGFASAAPGPIDVIVPPERRIRRPGLIVHRRRLAPDDVVHRHGLRVTVPALTLVHLAATRPERHLEHLLAEAFAQRLVTRDAILTCLATRPHAKGGTRLARMLDADLHRGRSHPERELQKAMIAAGLPRAELNLREGAWTPDLVWPDLGLVVEIDSYAFHSSPSAFARDRRKDRHQRSSGRATLRVTADEIRDDLLLVIADVARAVGRREALLRPVLS